MADGVQFVMDRMASAFRQMEEHEVFSAAEVKSVMKKRTDFEYVLKRRQLTVGDFYKYLEYEVNLEKLMTLRCEKELSGGGGKVAGKAKTRQDGLRNVKASAIRHICTVFERGIRRFPDEFDLLMDYVNFLKERKSNSILNEVFGRALALHPKHEDLWLQAAVHELDENNNVHAARVLLQTALRANKKSKKLWSRYFDLELWNAAKIHQRQEILKETKPGIKKTTTEEEEKDQLGLIAAPGVVFKHALQAVDDPALACEMHSSCVEVSEPLAQTLEEQLKEKFGTSSLVWRHLLVVASKDKRHLIAADDDLEESGNGKRKRASDYASLVCLSQCKTVKTLLTEYLSSEAASTGLSAKADILGALVTFQKQALASLEKSVEKRGELDAGVSSELLSAVEGIRGHMDEVADCESPDAVAAVPARASLAAAEYFSDLLREILSKSGSSIGAAKKANKKSGRAASQADANAHITALVSYIKQACVLLKGAITSSKASTKGIEAFTAAVSAWLEAAQLAGTDLGLRIDEVDEDEDEEDEGDDEDDDDEEGAGKVKSSRFPEAGELRGQLLGSLCDGASAIACMEGAPEIFGSLREAGDGEKEMVGQAMLMAMESPLCPPGVRGRLCSDYVEWVVSLSHEDGEDEEEEDSGAVLERAHALVRERVLKVPTRVAQAGMEHYYRSLAHLALQRCEATTTAITQEKGSSNNPFETRKFDDAPCVEFAREVLEAGLQHDSFDAALWEARERVERTYAQNTQKANHVRLRRDHALEPTKK